ncbi:hypothetical protein CRE_20024 [Caenorhabditis remanei]|uniref:Uncharacterized protein n=1 Tax=Caenorhabditis remanei TaxID=31234 RepID=E3NFF1_CAERE|nr:hypothetical protein CRE_20024 [Caenorhabditis remanei]
MSTPVRPKPYSLRTEWAVCRNSVIRCPAVGERRKPMTSPMRYSPMTRRGGPKDVTNAPSGKRTRPFHSSGFSPSPPDSAHLPIPRLQFENEDFMDLYSDDNQGVRPDSVSLLSQNLARSVITEQPPPVVVVSQSNVNRRHKMTVRKCAPPHTHILNF